MTLDVRGQTLVLEGAIEPGDGSRFRALLARNPQARILVLRESRGGDAEASIDISQAVRRAGLSTAVSGGCASGCGLIFLAGTKRMSTTEFPPNQTHLALHGSYSAEGRASRRYHAIVFRLVREYTGGRMPPALIRRWLALGASGRIYFFDPARPTPDGVQVFVCRGGERLGTQCAPSPALDARKLGVFTGQPAIAFER